MTDIRALIADLDEAIQSEPALAELPGRFMFGVDDGRADVSGLGADASAHYVGEATAALLLAGRDTGVRWEGPDVVPALVAVATQFAAVRGKAWRVAELIDTSPLLDHFTRSAAPGATWPPVVRRWAAARRRAHRARGCGAAGCAAGQGWGVPRGDWRTAGDHAVALGAGLRPRRGSRGCGVACAGADGTGVRRDVAVAVGQRVYGQPPLRTFGRRRTRGRHSGARRTRQRTPALRRLRTGVWQPTRRPGADRHGRRLSAARSLVVPTRTVTVSAIGRAAPAAVPAVATVQE